ncbi:MAG: DMT family transporter [Alphaproteobacteria bacterium]|nr:DMT family transporter [Alphaproteobacteria bacterium]
MTSHPQTDPPKGALSQIQAAVLPLTFVVFWSTGFIAGKYGLPYAGPMTFLVIRFVIVAVLLAGVAVVMRAPWPRRNQLMSIAIGGIFVHAGYLGATFAALSVGVEAGVASLMAGLQPLYTAALAGYFLNEQVRLRQWLGLLLGLCGVALVVNSKLALGLGTPEGMALSFLSAWFMTAGTLWQKRFGGSMDLRTGSVVQFAASAVVLLPFAIWWEGWRVEWTGHFIGALVWLCLVLSIGTISLLLILIRRGASVEVASLFFLVPPCTALFGALMFDEQLTAIVLSGMALVAIGVVMVTWKSK